MWNSVWVNSESDITNKNREMSQITHLPFTSCKASVFHKSTRSQLDWQKSYTEQRIYIDEKFIFVPYKNNRYTWYICQKCLKWKKKKKKRLKWIISTFDFVLTAKTKLFKIYKQKFLTSFRLWGKKKSNFHCISNILQLECYKDIKYIYCSCSSNFPSHYIWTELEFTKIASATLPRSYNLNTK